MGDVSFFIIIIVRLSGDGGPLTKVQSNHLSAFLNNERREINAVPRAKSRGSLLPVRQEGERCNHAAVVPSRLLLGYQDFTEIHMLESTKRFKIHMIIMADHRSQAVVVFRHKPQ
jgi:hypothetical protein